MIDRTLNYGRPVIRRFLTSIGPYQKVLDIGAGHGHDLMLAREVQPLSRLSALEMVPAHVKELKALDIDVHSFDIERQEYPFEPETFDVVMANQILEHTKEIFWIFDQMSRILKPGGHLIIGVPNLAALHNRIMLAFGLQPSPLKNNSAHVRGFTKHDLLRFMSTGFPGGYALRHFGGSNFYPFPPMIAKPLVRLLPNMGWGIFFHFQKVKPYRGEFIEYLMREYWGLNFFYGKYQPDLTLKDTGAGLTD